jgi:hypothetical protein
MKIVLAATVLLSCLAATALAQEKACSPADAANAEKVVDRVVNWDQFYKAYQDYHHCDKGAVEEVFTEALLRCIVEWKQVERLAGSMEKDKAFREFVYRHLGSPAAKGDIDAIYSRAKGNCPKGLDAFCTQIASAVKPFAGMEMKGTTVPAGPAAAPAAPATPSSAPKK